MSMSLSVLTDGIRGRRRAFHEVEVRGYFGRVHLEVENIPSDNPKTGRIVALSVAKALRNQTAPFVIGL